MSAEDISSWAKFIVAVAGVLGLREVIAVIVRKIIRGNPSADPWRLLAETRKELSEERKARLEELRDSANQIVQLAQQVHPVLVQTQQQAEKWEEATEESRQVMTALGSKLESLHTLGVRLEKTLAKVQRAQGQGGHGGRGQ